MLDEAVHHIDSAIPVTGSERFVATTDTPQRARFEPLKLDDLMEVPTTPEEWTKAAGSIAFVMGTSKAVVQMTEEKVVELTHGIGEERGSMLMHSFIGFIDLFKQSLALVENAEARILLAGGGDDFDEPHTGPVAPAAAAPDPVDVLFSEWCDTQEAMNQENMLDDAAQKAAEEDPSSRWNRLFDRLNEIEAEVIATSTSPMRTAAVATFELAACIDHDQTPRMLDRGACDTTWLALDTLALVRPHLTGRLAEIVGDLLDHPDRPFRDSKLHRLWTTPERAAELRERQREPMLQAAE